MEIVPDDSDDIVEPTEHAHMEEPAISLHALTGIQPRSTQTMKLPVWVGSTKLIALVDSGSTHNFISDDAVDRTGM